MTHEHIEAVIAKLERGEYGKNLPMVDNSYTPRVYGVKKQAVIQAMLDHPDAGPSQIARLAGCAPSYVTYIGKEMGL